MKTIFRFALLLAAITVLHTSDGRAAGMVTMVDLGAASCLPCKMMAPMLEELKTEYKDRAAIVFIDIGKLPDQARKYRISVIPTQIFFDRAGKEVFRHAGFMDRKTIVAQLAKMGVARPVAGSGR